jgi:peptide/nickel transport system permease protein
MSLAEQRVGAVATPAMQHNLLDELRRMPWAAMLILGSFLFVAAFADWLSPYGPQDMILTNRLLPPSWEGTGKQYLLGTDTLGRDLLTRVYYGARISLTIAAFTLLFGGGLGLVIGIVSGYVGGKVDAILMRLTDCFLALPTLLIALVFVMTLGPGLKTVVVAISLVTWSRFSRIVRSAVLSLKQREFVLQAKVAGCSGFRIMLVHIFPNVLNTFIVICSLQVSNSILTEATLSFLGAGIPPPTPTWGNMVADGRDFISSAWWISAFPGIALTLVVLSFNVFGDWLRDRLDPTLRQM